MQSSQFQKLFITPRRNTVPMKTVTPLPPPPGTTQLLSLCVDLPVLDTSHKWKHTACGLSCLVSPTWHVFHVHPRCSGYGCFLFKAEYKSIVCVYLLFIHSSADGYLGFSAFWLITNVAVTIHGHIFVRTRFQFLAVKRAGIA